MKIKQYVLSIIFKKDYYVFRRFKLGTSIDESFALHFVDPFKSKKEAKKAINNAKIMQPWQKFIILRS